jgi:hypothetical protein
MKHQIARPQLPGLYGTLRPLCILLLCASPVTSDAQVELRADRQILLEAERGTVTIKQGPGNKLYVLSNGQCSSQCNDWTLPQRSPCKCQFSKFHPPPPAGIAAAQNIVPPLLQRGFESFPQRLPSGRGDSHPAHTRALTPSRSVRAQEMAQEAFLRAYRSLDRWRREAAFSTWLFALATNLHCSELRRIPVRRVPLDDVAEPLDPRAADAGLEDEDRDCAVRQQSASGSNFAARMASRRNFTNMPDPNS